MGGNRTEPQKTSACSRAEPLVSIIIPAYQTSQLIGETLDSVFGQTFADFEVIIINDGSPDTGDLEAALKSYRGRIRYISQENQGIAGARNSGIRQARGTYLAFLDSDDCWLPRYLESQLKILRESPLLDGVYSDAMYFGDSRQAGKTFMQLCPSHGPVTLESLIRFETQPITSCTVVRRDVVIRAGAFDENLRAAEDYDLWLRIVYRGGRLAYHRQVLGRHRTRHDSLSRNTLKMGQALLRVYDKVDRSMDLKPDLRATLRMEMVKTQARIDLEMGKELLSAGSFAQAKESLTRAYHFSRSGKLKMAIVSLGLMPSFTRLFFVTWRGMLTRNEFAPVAPASSSNGRKQDCLLTSGFDDHAG